MDKTMVCVPVERFGNLLALEGSPRLIDAWNELLAAAPAPQPVQEEAVAWRYEFYGQQFTADPEQAEVARKQGCVVTPLFTQPPAPAVGDDTTERVCGNAERHNTELSRGGTPSA